MAENWFGLDWFGMVWFFVLQLLKGVLGSIHTKSELSMCLVCPTIEINVCSAYLQKVSVHFFLRHRESKNTALLGKGSVENESIEFKISQSFDKEVES